MHSQLLQEITHLQNQYEVFIIGDCFKAGKFFDASRQAYVAVAKIREGGVLPR